MNLEFLQQKLTSFGSKLTPELCKEFRAILDLFAQAHYEFGEQYKLAVINLIPSTVVKTDDLNLANLVNTTFSGTTKPVTPLPSFKPAAKQDITSIAIALGRNLELQLKNKQVEEKKEST